MPQELQGLYDIMRMKLFLCCIIGTKMGKFEFKSSLFLVLYMCKVEVASRYQNTTIRGVTEKGKRR
jgi:hypothetical protein